MQAPADKTTSPVDPRAAAVARVRPAHEAARARAARMLAGGAGGVAVARLYAEAADALVRDLWAFATEVAYPAANPTDAERLALLAVGGYGRGVLAPFSDLDLLFLRPWKQTSRGEQVTEFVQYALWDLGLKVGAATRSVEESLALAARDMTVRTTLLEARPLAGDAALAEDFLARFQRETARADPRPFIAAKLAERDQRHARAGAVRYKVEPNVKDGKGGLRDLNALFWIARGLAPDSILGERALEGLLTPRERRVFDDAFDFLWRVRAHMHLAAGRAVEALTFDLQPEVARRMGWRGRGDEPAVERFMRRYFLVARDVGALTRAMSAQLEARQQKKALTLSRLIPGRVRPLNERGDEPGLIVDEGRLSIQGPQVFAEDPVRLLTLFAAADRHDLDLHPDAFAAVTRSLSRVTPALRRDPRAARAFLDVLARGQRPYRVLTIMNETGLLGRFLPEWGRIVGQTQFNMYHAYTVDEHTLQAVGVLNDIAKGHLKADHPLASEVIKRVADTEALMLAMLLHDVGKGGDRGQLEDGAIAARRACERLGVDPRRTELVVWLVRHHLLFSDTAQKRDVSDPGTVRAFARRVGDLERLRLLLVLTVADIRAVGPGVWNGWKGQLMRDLHARAEAVFRGEDIVREDPLRAYPALAARARAGGAAAEAAPAPIDTGPVAGPGQDGVTRLAVAAPDRPGLFADLATALARAGADVVGARVATTDDGVALDVFALQDGVGQPYAAQDPQRLEALLRALEAAAAGTGPRPCALPAPPPPPRRAVFDVRPVVRLETLPGDVTVVEVSGPDRPGLLAELAGVFADQGLSIRSAHGAAFGERAADSFYVPSLDPARVEPLKAALTAVLDQTAPRGAVRASARDVSEIGAPPPSP